MKTPERGTQREGPRERDPEREPQRVRTPERELKRVGTPERELKRVGTPEWGVQSGEHSKPPGSKDFKRVRTPTEDSN